MTGMIAISGNNNKFSSPYSKPMIFLDERIFFREESVS